MHCPLAINELSHILCKFLVNLSFCAANDLLLSKRAGREKNHLFWPENGNAVQERLFAVKQIKTLIGIEFVCPLKLFIDVALNLILHQNNVIFYHEDDISIFYWKFLKNYYEIK